MQLSSFKKIVLTTGFILLIGLSLSNSGCNPSSKIIESDKMDTKAQLEEPASPGILLLNFEITSNDSVVLINSMLTRGLLREREPVSSKPLDGDLIISILDTSLELCAEKHVPNPLMRIVEYSEDHTTLKKKQVSLDSAQFSVRVQFQSCMRYARVKRVIMNQTKVLETFIIPTGNSLYE